MSQQPIKTQTSVSIKRDNITAKGLSHSIAQKVEGLSAPVHHAKISDNHSKSAFQCGTAKTLIVPNPAGYTNSNDDTLAKDSKCII